MNRPVIAGIALGGAAFILQLTLERRDIRRHPAPGQLIDVGGRRLHVVDKGIGSPCVVFESGLGCYSLDWRRIASYVSTCTRTVHYDRAGLGWSDRGPRPRDANAAARDLNNVLLHLGVTEPLVLVAHSFGGIYARVFAQLYLDRVAGMVLIDPSPTDQSAIFGSQSRARRWREQGALQLSRAGIVGNRFGTRRWFGGAAAIARFYPPEDRETALALESRSRATDWTVGEGLDVDASARQSVDDKILGSRPLVVVTALWREDERGMDHHRFNEAWIRAQSEVAKLSSTAIHVVANTSRHVVHLDEPELVAGVIRQVVERARREA